MSNEFSAAKLMQGIVDMDNQVPADTPGENLGPREQIIRQQVLEVLETIYDPEIPVNIYELGLIYDVAVNGGGDVYVRMTLTSPACPVAGTLPIEVETKIQAIPGVTDCTVEVVWDPPYSMEMMTESARLQLGLL